MPAVVEPFPRAEQLGGFRLAPFLTGPAKCGNVSACPAVPGTEGDHWPAEGARAGGILDRTPIGPAQAQVGLRTEDRALRPYRRRPAGRRQRTVPKPSLHSR